MGKIEESLNSLVGWIESERYMGYDPYDLITPFSDRFQRRALFYAQQFGKISPVNIRRIAGVKKAHNPKGLALISSAYFNMYNSTGNRDFLKKAENLINILKGLRSPGFEEFAWGYNFPWASRNFFLPAYQPSIVVSATVGKMLLKHHEITGKEESLKIAQSVGNFILKRLNRYETDRHLCFSYTPYDHSRTFNASLMGAEILSILYRKTGEKTFLIPAKKAARYAIEHQKKDGSWAYGYSENGKEMELYDFHQGFVLDSLKVISESLDMEMKKPIDSGLRFYREKLFYENGMSVYRYPKVYPTDIHNQAQGILTFNRHGDHAFSHRVALWTIENMQDKEGYFHYQAWPNFSNRIPYMRWGQAWMMLALSYLTGVRGSDGG